MLRMSKRVHVGKMAFPDQEIPQACTLASQPIPADTYLWELNAILSLDVVPQGAISIMQAHPSQNLAPGNRIMAGSARIANHHCNSNASVRKFSYLYFNTNAILQLEPIPDFPIFVVKTVRDIAQGEEITVNYGNDYWETGACLCSQCTGRLPTYSTRSERGLPSRP